jgi:hypothetical protein
MATILRALNSAGELLAAFVLVAGGVAAYGILPL